MKVKLFKVIFATLLVVMLFLALVIAVAGRDNILVGIVVGLVLAAVLSFFVSGWISSSFARRINQINIMDPDEKEVYTELKPLVKRISAQNSQLFVRMDMLKEEHKKQDSLRREFTANVSHELKTPLTSISGYAELIENGLAKKEDIPAFASRIHSETDRMLSLVEDIIRLSHLDEGDIPRETESINLLEEANTAAEELFEIAAKRNVTITVSGEEVKVISNRRMIFEIIRNLCDNAVKYNKEGGKVEITVGYNLNKQPFVKVADTGIGIPEEEKDRIFERFYRVDKSRSKAAGGTGLGLSIVKHAAIKVGAEISLESAVGKGTEITVTF